MVGYKQKRGGELLYIECKHNGCPRPIQGTIEITRSSPSNDGRAISFRGKCTDGHNVGRGLSKENQLLLSKHGWVPPEPGKSHIFELPKVKVKNERLITVPIPDGVKYVLVNVESHEVIPLPGAQVTKVMGESSKKVQKIIVDLGEKPVKRDISKKNKELREEVRKKPPKNPFKPDGKFHKVVEAIYLNDKVSIEKANRLTGKDWDGNKWIKFLHKKGVESVTYTEGSKFIRN